MGLREFRLIYYITDKHLVLIDSIGHCESGQVGHSDSSEPSIGENLGILLASLPLLLPYYRFLFPKNSHCFRGFIYNSNGHT